VFQWILVSILGLIKTIQQFRPFLKKIKKIAYMYLQCESKKVNSVHYEIQEMVSKKTSSSAIAERPRCRMG